MMASCGSGCSNLVLWDAEIEQLQNFDELWRICVTVVQRMKTGGKTA